MTRARDARGLCAGLLASVALVLLPWAAALGIWLPGRHQVAHWNIAWMGFDVLLAIVLLTTALALWRGRPWLPIAGAVAATLLVCDAWFDVLTASGRDELIAAAALAGCAELPLAVVCAALAVRELRRPVPGRPIGGRKESSDSSTGRISASASSHHA
jgi:hypothetical protein